MKGSVHEEIFIIFHDALVLMIAKETITWMKDNNYSHSCSEYEGYFCAAYEAFRNGQVAATQKGRKRVGKIGVPLSDL